MTKELRSAIRDAQEFRFVCFNASDDVRQRRQVFAQPVVASAVF
jgi:hypothetical protein